MLKAFGACLLTVVSSVALAGGMESGGGNAIVCGAGSGKTVQLYDFVEATYFDGAVFPKTSETQDQQVKAALARLGVVSSLSAYNLSDYLSIAKGKIKWLSNVTLQPSQDFGSSRPVVVPDECKLEGLAFFDSKGRLNISQEAFDAMDPMGQAGLLLHEAAYSFWRYHRPDITGPVTSENIRTMIANLFAENGIVTTADAKQLQFLADEWSCTFIDACDSTGHSGKVGAPTLFEIPTFGRHITIRYESYSTATDLGMVECYSATQQLLWSLNAPAMSKGEADISECRYTRSFAYPASLYADGRKVEDLIPNTMLVGHP